MEPRTRLVALAVALVVSAGCSLLEEATPEMPPAASGFLDDYSRLRRGGADELHWVYRDPDADWPRYQAVLMEPVTLWRSGKDSLAAVPEDDLQHLVNLLQRAIRARLGEGFRLVDAPGPDVMRIRLGIAAAHADDRMLDVMTAHDDESTTGPTGALDPDTRDFIASAVIEGEIRSAETNDLLAQGLDRRPDDVAPPESWAEVERRLIRWADRVCSRLEARAAGQ